MSNAMVGPGFLLKIDTDDAGTGFTAIAEIQEIDGVDLKTNMHKVTSQASAGGFAEQKPGVIDAQPIKGTANFLPSDTTQNATAGLIYLQINRLRRQFQITNPFNAVKWQGHCYVSEAHTKYPLDGPAVLDFTLEPDGGPTLS